MKLSDALVMTLLGSVALASCAYEHGTATQLPDRVPVEYVGLAGSTWQLVEFRSNDDAAGKSRPSDPSKYVMSLNGDGSVNFRLDCNRGNGSWKASDGGRATSGQISFSSLAVTKALCPPPSMGEKLERDTQYMRTYLVQSDRLYINLMADGGTYVWEPSTQ